jgi:hypothetical protein
MPAICSFSERILVMRRTARARGFLLLAVVLALGASPAWGQEAPEVERFTVALWPEYDRSAVLVTYRVELSPEVALPAHITLPIPADVGMPHAVAWRGEDGKLYLAEAIRKVDGEWAVMHVTTDSHHLQLEYYAPFSTSADARNFTYRWRGGLEVKNFIYEVLPPVFATDLAVTPPPSREVASRLGVPLQVGELGARSATQPQTIAITYSNPSGRLSATPAPPPPAASPPPLISSGGEQPSPKTAVTQPSRKISTVQFVVIGSASAAVVLVGLWFARRRRGAGDS